jgi:formylglycine-generating enzyme
VSQAIKDQISRSAPDAPVRLLAGRRRLKRAPNYCLRFRPAARQGQTVETSSAHLGFRCIRPGRAD